MRCKASRPDHDRWGPGEVPIGSFTDPEYAQVGLTEDATPMKDTMWATAGHTLRTPLRTIIDGRKVGFCKLIVDRRPSRNVVGERVW